MLTEGINIAKKLLLDLRAVTKEAINQAYFDRLDEHSKEFNLETALEYVALLEPKTHLPTNDELLALQGIDQRSLAKLETEVHSPYHFFFREWLRKKQKVQKIFEVIVEDSPEVPHSDKHIVECIRDFDVEVFNWRKLDISIETIKKAAPNASVVHLYCVGGNSVFQSWLGGRGLRILDHVSPYYCTTMS